MNLLTLATISLLFASPVPQSKPTNETALYKIGQGTSRAANASQTYFKSIDEQLRAGWSQNHPKRGLPSVHQSMKSMDLDEDDHSSVEEKVNSAKSALNDAAAEAKLAIVDLLKASENRLKLAEIANDKGGLQKRMSEISSDNADLFVKASNNLKDAATEGREAADIILKASEKKLSAKAANETTAQFKGKRQLGLTKDDVNKLLEASENVKAAAHNSKELALGLLSGEKI